MSVERGSVNDLKRLRLEGRVRVGAARRDEHARLVVDGGVDHAVADRLARRNLRAGASCGCLGQERVSRRLRSDRLHVARRVEGELRRGVREVDAAVGQRHLRRRRRRRAVRGRERTRPAVGEGASTLRSPARITFCRSRSTSAALPSAANTAACSAIASRKAARSPVRTACSRQ